MKNNRSIINVIFALLLAAIAGYLTGPTAGIFGVPFVDIFGLVGELFLNGLSLVVVPLVASSIILGAARMGGDATMGYLGIKTIVSFILTTTLAVLVGYAVVTSMTPGIDGGHPSTLTTGTDTVALETKVQNLEQLSEGGGFAKFKELLLKMVPSNILAAASQSQMMGLILFCLMFGYFSMKIEGEPSRIMLGFWKALFQTMMKMTEFFMKALPIGVFALVAKVVATSGSEAFSAIAWFFASVLLALGIYVALILPFLLKYVAKVSPLAHVKAMFPALLTAFSTSSSAASLPVVIDCMEKRVGVSNHICSFTLPLGTAMSLSGSALYVCMVVFFVSQVYGVVLPLSTQILVIFMSVVTSFGAAGIPSACLISIVVILQAVGLPIEGIGFVLAVERILDMFRTAANTFGNSCCAVLVAKSEGESVLFSGDEAFNSKISL
ncbi:MAG: dicarboxylate/amino acid:cation symporter [Parachlamydiaceae bacterium]|nr:dicarboxylate/amino acid:cation symporter [Parachlamydiaceae bacterium]